MFFSKIQTSTQDLVPNTNLKICYKFEKFDINTTWPQVHELGIDPSPSPSPSPSPDNFPLKIHFQYKSYILKTCDNKFYTDRVTVVETNLSLEICWLMQKKL